METLSNRIPLTVPSVLVIDDDTQFVYYISQLLEYEGYRVYKAFDGKGGIMEYIQRQPNLVITDIVMPEKEGLELIMEIRKQDSEIPIIAVSGGNHGYGDSYLAVAKKFGANAILQKPFDSETLLATVNEFIGTV